jgi:hypothetical protein
MDIKEERPFLIDYWLQIIITRDLWTRNQKIFESSKSLNLQIQKAEIKKTIPDEKENLKVNASFLGGSVSYWDAEVVLNLKKDGNRKKHQVLIQTKIKGRKHYLNPILMTNWKRQSLINQKSK